MRSLFRRLAPLAGLAALVACGAPEEVPPRAEALHQAVVLDPAVVEIVRCQYQDLTLTRTSNPALTKVRKVTCDGIYWYEAGTADGLWYVITQVTWSGNGGKGFVSIPGSGGSYVAWR